MAIARAPQPAPNPQPPKEPSRYAWALMVIFAIVGLVFLGGVLMLIYTNAVPTQEAARNVITLVVSVGTISLAIILVLAVLLQEDPSAMARFEKGKEVLTILVGILGTIVGFYFGAATVKAPDGSPNKGAVESVEKGGPAPKNVKEDPGPAP